MAFKRFVTRYAAATRDTTFTEKLGPVLAVHNATIFNHFLAQLLSRNIVEPTKATPAFSLHNCAMPLCRRAWEP